MAAKSSSIRENGILTALMAVKNTPRTGWMLRGVPAAIAETIAEHMAESAIIALTLAESLQGRGVKVSPERAATIALIHDLAEGFIGDIVKKAIDKIGKNVKEDIELSIAGEEFGNNTLIYRLLEAYIRQETNEARVAKFAEQLSTLIESLRYIRSGYPVEEITCNILESLVKNRYLIAGHDLYSLAKDMYRGTLEAAEELCRREKR